ncbi:hypothetical protein BGY98DRAFT_982721, partial [Russula aff. rugulosa BPL654]
MGTTSMPLRQAGITSTEQAVWGRLVSSSTMRLLSKRASVRGGHCRGVRTLALCGERCGRVGRGL